MREFMYCFQITKLIVFEVQYYTLGSNTAPHFSTCANKFCRSKRDYTEVGQAQARLLPHASAAYRFYKKFDPLHLHDLTPAQYEEITAELEKLKAKYNYIEYTADTFRGGRSHIPFFEVQALSKMDLKKAT